MSSALIYNQERRERMAVTHLDWDREFEKMCTLLCRLRLDEARISDDVEETSSLEQLAGGSNDYFDDVEEDPIISRQLAGENPGGDETGKALVPLAGRLPVSNNSDDDDDIEEIERDFPVPEGDSPVPRPAWHQAYIFVDEFSVGVSDCGVGHEFTQTTVAGVFW